MQIAYSSSHPDNTFSAQLVQLGPVVFLKAESAVLFAKKNYRKFHSNGKLSIFDFEALWGTGATDDKVSSSLEKLRAIRDTYISSEWLLNNFYTLVHPELILIRQSDVFR